MFTPCSISISKKTQHLWGPCDPDVYDLLFTDHINMNYSNQPVCVCTLWDKSQTSLFSLQALLVCVYYQTNFGQTCSQRDSLIKNENFMSPLCRSKPAWNCFFLLLNIKHILKNVLVHLIKKPKQHWTPVTVFYFFFVYTF